MDQTRLDAIRARCEAATPGPWEIRVRGNTVQSHQVVMHGEYSRTDVNIASGISTLTHNADFIAHARTDVPDMLDEVERLKADRDTWRRRSECAERDISKMLKTMPVGMCKQFCKRAGSMCGAWADCAPEWRGPEEDKHGTA